MYYFFSLLIVFKIKKINLHNFYVLLYTVLLFFLRHYNIIKITFRVKYFYLSYF